MTKTYRIWMFILVLGAACAAPCRADESAKTDQAPQVNWPAQLREWRTWYTAVQRDPAKSREAALAALEAIDDPAAVPPIVSLLKSEKHGQFRRALLRPLINLGGKEAVGALVKWSVEDDNPVLRQEAAEGLVGKEELAAQLDTYIEYLRNPKFAAASAQALRWTKLAVRQSSSEALNEKLTKALIDALVQKQKKRVPYWVAVDTGWIPHAGTGSGFGRYRHREYKEDWVEVMVPVQNTDVHATLTQYSSQNFAYDQQAWAKALNIGGRR
jgi:hypothetical protein